MKSSLKIIVLFFTLIFTPNLVSAQNFQPTEIEILTVQDTLTATTNEMLHYLDSQRERLADKLSMILERMADISRYYSALSSGEIESAWQITYDDRVEILYNLALLASYAANSLREMETSEDKKPADKGALQNKRLVWRDLAHFVNLFHDVIGYKSDKTSVDKNSFAGSYTKLRSRFGSIIDDILQTDLNILTTALGQGTEITDMVLDNLFALINYHREFYNLEEVIELTEAVYAQEIGVLPRHPAEISAAFVPQIDRCFKDGKRIGQRVDKKDWVDSNRSTLLERLQKFLTVFSKLKMPKEIPDAYNKIPFTLTEEELVQLKRVGYIEKTATVKALEDFIRSGDKKSRALEEILNDLRYYAHHIVSVMQLNIDSLQENPARQLQKAVKIFSDRQNQAVILYVAELFERNGVISELDLALINNFFEWLNWQLEPKSSFAIKRLAQLYLNVLSPDNLNFDYSKRRETLTSRLGSLLTKALREQDVTQLVTIDRSKLEIAQKELDRLRQQQRSLTAKKPKMKPVKSEDNFRTLSSSRDSLSSSRDAIVMDTSELEDQIDDKEKLIRHLEAKVHILKKELFLSVRNVLGNLAEKPNVFGDTILAQHLQRLMGFPLNSELRVTVANLLFIVRLKKYRAYPNSIDQRRIISCGYLLAHTLKNSLEIHSPYRKPGNNGELKLPDDIFTPKIADYLYNEIIRELFRLNPLTTKHILQTSVEKSPTTAKLRTIFEGLNKTAQTNVIRQLLDEGFLLRLASNESVLALEALLTSVPNFKDLRLTHYQDYLKYGEDVPGNAVDLIFDLPTRLKMMFSCLDLATKRDDDINDTVFGPYLPYDVPHDGNCFFHALADQLRRVHKQSCTHLQLRAIAIKQLREHPEDYRAFIEKGKLDAYIQEMERDHEWADGIVIQALVDALKIRLIIHTSDGDTIVLGSDTTNPPLHLGYYVNWHYLSLGVPAVLSNVSATEVTCLNPDILRLLIKNEPPVAQVSKRLLQMEASVFEPQPIKDDLVEAELLSSEIPIAAEKNLTSKTATDDEEALNEIIVIPVEVKADRSSTTETKAKSSKSAQARSKKAKQPAPQPQEEIWERAGKSKKGANKAAEIPVVSTGSQSNSTKTKGSKGAQSKPTPAAKKNQPLAKIAGSVRTSRY